MGWLQRLFGLEKPHNEETAAPQSTSAPVSTTPSAAATETIPAERVGLNGEYDQSGLAKRVALAFDQNPEVADIDSVYVAQLGSTVVLKGKVPNQEVLNKLVNLARVVNGATGVETNQVTVG
ncbi:MAG TPA: BON domain-containing protein [Kamptonema sp.]|nr:BON domain-containing protein [Kamptonema sp.]